MRSCHFPNCHKDTPRPSRHAPTTASRWNPANVVMGPCPDVDHGVVELQNGAIVARANRRTVTGPCDRALGQRRADCSPSNGRVPQQDLKSPHPGRVEQRGDRRGCEMRMARSLSECVVARLGRER
ncbi:hypothetical protein AMAG_18331 [Allomyces macrogynus ATCC 38327]|uniref:Uncharacterized protein n=1 Tax=Allomyces macrogynus (strain ATCC 38327) TaxID=578462 RepID=A0A0L0S935_ALLM3|nr:hypothetical protein AMAG_18331 [Allomyces macrogynus ATCC 38327]|eukprot:KNE58924.1 hypothetical protein AMAG_18331 [Allomyces macrogynus ATCC 38327]